MLFNVLYKMKSSRYIERDGDLTNIRCVYLIKENEIGLDTECQ